MERLKFMLRARGGRVPFWYKDATGGSLGYQGYNPFTDMVTYRPGQFGTSGFGPYPKMSREDFLAQGDHGYRDLRSERTAP